MRIFSSLSFFLAPLLFIGSASAENHGPAPSCPLSTLDGTKVFDPTHQKGKVVYVDFWASWCGPCAQSFPFLNQLQNDLKGKGLEVVAVNLDENLEDAVGFIDRHPANFTVVSDPKGKCPALFDVRAMPTSYIVDRQGNIRHIHLGFKDGDKNAIRDQVQALVSEP